MRIGGGHDREGILNHRPTGHGEPAGAARDGAAHVDASRAFDPAEATPSRAPVGRSPARSRRTGPTPCPRVWTPGSRSRTARSSVGRLQPHPRRGHRHPAARPSRRGAVDVGPLASTRMACEGDGGQVERHVLQVLDGAVRSFVALSTLVLERADGLGLVFEAAAEAPAKCDDTAPQEATGDAAPSCASPSAGPVRPTIRPAAAGRRRRPCRPVRTGAARVGAAAPPAPARARRCR